MRVGIVSWNTAELLDRCLTALPAALGGTDADVVVVDNASTDASAEVAAGHAHTRPRPVRYAGDTRDAGGIRSLRVVRNTSNVGYGQAMNHALAGGDADVLIALNPDTEPPPGSLASLVDRLWADPAVGLVAPRLVTPDGTVDWTARRFPSIGGAALACALPGRWQDGRIGRRFLLERAAQPSTPTDVDWAIGAVHVIRASAFAGRAPYDERWFMYVEDLELCWWLARRGWRRRFEADVPVVHVGNASGAQAWADEYMGRCFDAVYDWYERDRSRVGVRLLAAAHAARVASRTGVGILARRPEEHLAALRRELPHHLRVVGRGAPPPGGPPPTWR